MLTKIIIFFQRKKVVGTIPNITTVIIEELNKVNDPQLKSDILSEILLELYNEGYQELAFDLAEKFSLPINL